MALVCGRDEINSEEIEKANCALILAAPALLKALEGLLEYTGGFDLCASHPNHPIAKAFAVVAQAKNTD